LAILAIGNTLYYTNSQEGHKRVEENIGLENNSNDRGYTFYVMF
jgi:hypothetical protein